MVIGTSQLSLSPGRQVLGALALILGVCFGGRAATLTGSFTPIAAGTEADLTLTGKLDWVHWGLGADHAIDRKASVAPLISDFSIVSMNVASNPMSFATSYWLDDPSSGTCSWSDGNPTISATNTYSRVLAYSYPTLGGCGFKLTLPADTTTRTLTLYVGTISSLGELRATLTGTAGYSPTAVGSNVNGFFTISYAANSANQTMTVTWTLPVSQTSGYVTLQAAAVTAPGANNPPFATLSEPTTDSMIFGPANIPISASAQDFDGTVTNVAFYANATLLGHSANNPYGLTWSNAPLGHYLLTAVAADNAGTSRSSVPVEIYVYGTNGSQICSVSSNPPPAIDLTAEGTLDWVHWGLVTNTSVDRKANVTAQISNFTPIGNGTAQRYTDNYSAFAWSDGTPTVATNGTTTGVFIYGPTNGFALTLPADTTQRTARFYVGNYAAHSHFAAYLSDFSAKPYVDTSLNDVSWNNEYGSYEITYRAASSGQQLNIAYRPQDLYDTVYGNVTLQSVTLQSDLPPVTILNPRRLGGDFVMSFNTLSSHSYSVQYCDELPAPAWINLTTIPGDGSLLTVTNYNLAGRQRFYRVETQ